MSTVSVSTWAEFAANLVLGAIDVIEVTADLDCNDDIPTVAIGVNSNSGSLTINGNGHTLFNLTTNGGVGAPLFWLNVNTIVNELNLYNCARTEAQNFFRSTSEIQPTFNDCKIVGAAQVALTYRGVFNRCSYTWRNIQGSALHGACTFVHSWVHIDATRTSDNYGRAEIGVLNNSYLEGTWENNFGGTPSTLYTAAEMLSSVINVNYASSLAGASTMPDISVGNISKAPNLVTGEKLKGATDAGMKDASYLAALGFNIIS